MNVVIPTYKRANALAGKDYFTFARYVLPESQRDEYAKVLPADRMIVIPDDQDGSITRKRNWILNNIERPFCMMDDDVEYLLMMEGRSREKSRFISYQRIDQEIVLDVIKHYTDLACQFGAKLWGVSQRTSGDEREYKEWRPFSLTNVILGPFQVHLDHNLMFDDRMGTKDDYDMALQHFLEYRMVLRVDKLAYKCGHGDNAGGIVASRTKEREEAYCMAIMKKWGTKVIRYKMPAKKMGDLLNGKVSVPIKGV